MPPTNEVQAAIAELGLQQVPPLYNDAADGIQAIDFARENIRIRIEVPSECMQGEPGVIVKYSFDPTSDDPESGALHSQHPIVDLQSLPPADQYPRKWRTNILRTHTEIADALRKIVAHAPASPVKPRA